MSPRTGRPTDNPKKERLGIRIAEDQLKKLEICCQKTGLSKTEIICKGIDLVYKEVAEK